MAHTKTPHTEWAYGVNSIPSAASRRCCDISSHLLQGAGIRASAAAVGQAPICWLCHCFSIVGEGLWEGQTAGGKDSEEITTGKGAPPLPAQKK